MPIKILLGRQIIDATGVPTVEVDLVTELGLFRIGVPSTDIKKMSETIQLRDVNSPEYGGMGVLQAVKNVNNIIAPELIKQGYEVTMQEEIDDFLISLDGTECRQRLGSNAIMAVSMAVAKAGAAKKGIPLYRHIADMASITSIILPVPHFLILTGGILADNNIPFQEYSVMPTGAVSFTEAMRIGVELHTYVKNIVREKYGVSVTYVSDSGGFALPLQTHRDALLFLTDVIKQCGYYGKVEIAVNACAGDIYKDGGYDFEFKNVNSNPQDYVSQERLAEIYLDNTREFPLGSIEDAFSNDDWGAWSLLAPRMINAQLLANNLTQSNLKKIGMAVDKKACSSIALRLNQAGTLTEIIEGFKVAKQGGLGVCVCDRWGDTEDLFLADLAVGLSCGQIKCGAPVRCERIGKYNQILRIEEELGPLAKYAGKNYRNPL